MASVGAHLDRLLQVDGTSDFLSSPRALRADSALLHLQMSSLADPKSTHELNALKGVSLDHVGSIAARIRQDKAAASHWPAIRTLQEVRDSFDPSPCFCSFSAIVQIVGASDLSALEQLYSSQQQLIAHLVRADKAEVRFGSASRPPCR